MLISCTSDSKKLPRAISIECKESTIEEDFLQSEQVIIGKITNLVSKKEGDFIDLDTERIWKGGKTRSTKIHIVDARDTSYGFTTGDRVLIFANNGKTEQCSGTTKIENNLFEDHYAPYFNKHTSWVVVGDEFQEVLPLY